MQIYNTLNKKKEEFIPWNNDKVTMYTCGPTVYHDQHIGNMRNYIGHDILEKSLRYLGYNVVRCMNITDVGHLSSDADTGEDKMVKSAKEKNTSVMEIAKYYTEQFFTDFKMLNNKVPDIVSPATENIEEYIKIITKLLDTGYAYSSGGNIYFDTSKLDDYYKLTNFGSDDLISGVRDTVTEDENKRNKNDFVLWFTKSKFDSQDLKWDSPFGTGYPGWHIECSGISIKYLGEYLDIHGGGVDNIFPHHTNEIAQSESYIGHKWCNYWFHNEHLMDSEGKMSKSKGATLTVSLLKEKGYDPLAFRFLCLQSHYRKQLVFSYDSLDTASVAYKKLLNKTLSLKDDGNIDNESSKEYLDKFKEYISNDLNTSSVITLLFDTLKSNLNDSTKKYLVSEYDKVLSLDLLVNKSEEIDNDKEQYILSKIEERKQAKLNKDYALADKIRNDLLSEGIELIDTREGTTYKIQ